MLNVFLSASIPLPNRDRQFYDTADILAIREALKALVEAVLPVGRLTTGGHPAITPLIALFVREAQLPKDRLTIFQSQIFFGQLPQANQEFADVRFTPAVKGNVAASLSAMREAMLKSQNFDVAVLIGGMEGVIDEAAMFRRFNPGAPVLPIASTGAAAATVFGEGEYPEELATELTYPTLFRRFLPPHE